ncbi:nucleotidyl transferase AbiEii/AbiGii toxin family protein [Flavobacterium aquicola]|uniref:Nucleotidyltransferase AbiEii toxin of type IV toxin-antitoxin system n=1 Tax=Flavobacterium aquicola TaxID=1682742 RepID=A0A3E0EUA8_9FLAO|nr:nucleotidyl transferase AbiEii/AbiGii toxin family protein [Flavobacterium aquicola]REH01000.1 nucleotidyltransferase AbiEii toxin of type IV toxin-antitoxin system [Flavobacterium aquicola]
MLCKETVTKEMWELLQRLMKDEKLKDYILVGGTALALRLGHRLSIDIDLFTTKDFDSLMMLKYLHDTYGANLKESRLSQNTVLTHIDDIKIDLITHNYPLLNSVEETEGVRMISNEDIGAMKLHAIHQSGDRYKDFVDMYFMLEQEPLKFYLQAYQKKYDKDPYWASIGLNTYDKITTFEGVDMLKEKQQNWKNIQKRLELAVKNQLYKFKSEREDLPINPNKKRGFRR